MKLAFAIVLTALATVARADNVFQHATQIRALGDDVSAEFIVNTDNPELGRAWIQISDEYQDPLMYDDKTSRSDVTDIAVPGLAYNAQTKEITYSNRGEQIICATNVRHSFFKGLTSDSTGRCNLQVRKERTTRDDGFNLHPASRAVVTLNP